LVLFSGKLKRRPAFLPMTSGVDSPVSASPSGATSLVGKVLSERYRIESVLGEGGMGAVYLAEHVLMHKRLAVKVLHPEMTRMPEIVARFEREAMAAAHIEHPNVAAATDFGKLEDGSFFLVLEYVEGTSLRDLIAKGPLGAERALHIAYQIGAALARAHSLGIVHRDLKPENVMLVEREGDPNFVKVLDFGIAKVPVGGLSRGDASPPQSGQVLTQLGMVYGTPEYMAPEQALGQEVDARADLYALGVILFEMLTGVRPFEADSKVTLLGMKVTSDPPTMASKNPDARVQDSVEAIVRRLLDKEAANRYPDAREVLDGIDGCRMATAKTEHNLPAVPTPLGMPASARYRASLASVPRTAVDIGPGSSWAQKSAQAIEWLTDVRDKLPAPLSQVSPFALLGGAGLVLIVIVWSILALRSPSSVSSASPNSSTAISSPPLLEKLIPPPTAPPDALTAAVAAGPAQLEDLSARYPGDPAVWRALMRTYTKDKRGADAMRAVAKLVGLNERAADEDEVMDAISSAAQGPAESADAAFALLQDAGLGAKGPDILYDLSTTKGLSPRTVTRVKQTLAKQEVKSRMSPALQIAMDLKNATGCEAKRALLPKAKDSGDARALAALRGMLAPKGCGFLGLGDCWACMRKDGALGATISAIEERTGK
jgi:serine/threonine-protein kinase